MIRPALLLAATVLLACGGPGAPPATTGPSVPDSSTGPGVSTTTATAPPATTGCTAPTRDLVVLCEGYELVDRYHVDPPDPEELAAAALLGLAELVPPIDGSPATMPPCPVPAEGFGPVCDRISALAAGGIQPGAAATAAVVGMYRYGLDPFSAYLPAHPGGAVPFPPGSLPWLGLSVAIVGPDDRSCPTVGDGCRLVVTSVLPYSGAEEAGLIPGDEVVRIAGETVEGWTIDRVGTAFAVPGGVRVEIQVARPGSVLTKQVVAGEPALDPGRFEMIGPRLAYLGLSDLSQDAARYAGAVLGLPDVQLAEGLVLDLRGNPGGPVLAAQAVASQFLAGGEVFTETGRDGTRSWPVLEGGLAPPGLPVVVVVDGGTASAAEIVAASLREAGRATIVGVPTFGKHLVQQVFDARDGGVFRVTISRWSTPAGAVVAFAGLSPDVIVDEPPSVGADPALDRAIALLTG